MEGEAYWITEIMDTLQRERMLSCMERLDMGADSGKKGWCERTKPSCLDMAYQ